MVRHSCLSCGIVLVCFVGAGAAACAAQGSDGSQHGPDFSNDAGHGAETAPSDARGEAAAVDGAMASDSNVSGDTNGGPDAPDAIPQADASDAGSASDAPKDVVVPDASGCTQSAALIAGSAGSLAASIFTAGQWSAATSLSGSAQAAPAVASFGAGFEAVIEAQGGALEAASYASSWSTLTPIGPLAAGDPSALVALGAKLHLTYLGKADNKFYHGTFDGMAWDAAQDPVGGSGAMQSFGPSAPSAAAAAGALIVAQGGNDGVLYTQTFDTVWHTAQAQSGTQVELGLRPTILALTGSAADLLVVYLRKTDRHLMFAARTLATWSAPAEVYDTAGNVAFSDDPVALAPLAGGGAVVAFRGSDLKPYFSRWNATTWSAPAPLVAGTNPTLASPPSLAAGVCGGDVLAAFVDTTGAVKVATLSGSSWSPPSPIVGAAGMTYVGVATKP